MCSSQFLLPFIIFNIFINISYALNCYQCSGSDSNKPFQCNEWLSSDIDINPEPCDSIFGAKYCIKHVGRFEGGIGAKRFCSSLDLGNYCNYVKQPGDSLTYRTCVYTCTGEGCNPANTRKPYSSLLLSVTTLLIMFRFR
ncbi:U-scoloptoxin(05)-Sm1a isoform X1 [Diorhabda sublineata]|uniref:U-scoloptoxin(05)-Sm1a isoform X1 n=1 Tax=Diorhabda sublineata TaxID=1163346 RepID=UPI0024E1877C|nr:U-scoloptoxin(05)-Sm1a isoform X1 [Diorhabda sublineata]